MAFPTTPLLDNFNRANANPLSGLLWVNKAYSSADSNLQIVSNQVTATGGNGSAYWNKAVGPDSEVYYTFVTLCALTQASVLGIRLVNPGVDATITGYNVYFENDSPTPTIKFFENTHTTLTQLGATVTQAISAGNKIGIGMVGTTLTAYLNTGSWASISSRTDSTHTGAGVIAMELDDTTGVLDDFGGGTVNQVADICSQQMDRPENTKTVILPI